ncbi:leukocyte immunoglobulin-like receptor subfamily B member 3-like [Xiphophorus hellerii]|uniref:leukocyte immunoglobulin-like receptor subfamily B member 3-like n=1 Tax=Xiphophorus hellerii TaxID=8084 RepID=UPI0013B3AEC5|nr:leukocyte immunoglobulin-like receptor subfamily B member 3-like [Xiphophorus hellerii]
MGNTSPRVLVSLLLNTLLCCGQTLDPVLTVEPNWSTFYVGEFVTFICDINEGRNSDCQYRLIRNGQEFVRYQSDKHFRVDPLYTDYSGEFQCCRQWRVSPDENCSKTVTFTVSDKPRAKLTAGPTTIPVGGSVTLSCSVEPSAGWKYRWFRRTSDSSFVEFSRNNEENREITVTQGGIYECDGERGNTSFYSHPSLENIIEIMFSNKVFVTRQPNGSHIISGESITLTCEVQGGETTEWTCEWRRSGSIIHKTDSKDWTFIVSESSSGNYMCQCRSRDDWYSSTQRSETIRLSVSTDKPGAKLAAGSTTIPVGGSVTLSCSVEPSAGWKYRWFRRTSDSSFVEFSRNNEENREITVTQGGIYKCDGERGNPSFYSHSSLEKIIEIMFSNKVFVTRQPNWPQMFSGESITLTCEVQGGETTEWTCGWRRSGSIIHKTDSKDWTFIVSESSSGNYMCQCRIRDDWYSSTQWSETIRLSVSTKPGAKLAAGSTTIPVGGSVTLSCSVEPSAGWKYRWFRRTSDTSFVEFSRNNEENREITVTQGGIYKCDGERGNPSFYSHSSHENNIEMILTVSSPVISSFPVMLIVGPVSGIVLIVLLLLLWRCRRSKDLCCIRLFQSESSSQRPTTNHGVNQTESDYSFLLHGTTSVYETIHNRGATGNERPPDPEEGSVYVNVRPDNYSSA